MSAYWSALLYLNKHNNKCWSAHGSGDRHENKLQKIINVSCTCLYFGILLYNLTCKFLPVIHASLC